MSQWGNDSTTQPAATGQVTFFDPSKFQQKDNSGFQQVPVSQQNAGNVVQSHDGNQQNVNYQDNQGSSWNSWGTWDTSNPYGGDLTGSNVQNGQAVNNEYGNYDQHQYYGNQQWNTDQQTYHQGSEQWNNAPQPVTSNASETQWNHLQQGGTQWDPNAQNSMDPNNQWNHQYGYQHQTDPNNAGYQNYWGSQNGEIQTQGDIVVSSGAHGVSSVNYFGVDPNVQSVQSVANVPNVTNSNTGSGDGDSGGLDVSQSTETSGSGLNQSVGNVEDGGMGGFFNNDEYEDDEDDDESGDEEDDDDENDDEESNNENNSNLGASGSHIETENENEHNIVNSDVHVQASAPVSHDLQNVHLTNQMEGLSIADNVSSNSVGYNVSGQNVPQYSNQNSVTNVLPGASTVPQPSVHPFVPQFADNNRGGVNVESTEDDENDAHSAKQQTPTFSDWEMVPPQSIVAAHSRNASIDNNVQFFIGSGNSSARVSPATSAKTSDEQGTSVDQVSVKQEEKDLNKVKTSVEANPPPVVGSQGNPQNLGPPPPMMPGPGGVNPFRKSPNMEPVTSSSDVSLLSSTRLDVTRPNYENSPVVLNQSISPIPVTKQQSDDLDRDSPEIQTSNQSHASVQDTPLSSQSKKSKSVSQSPIMPRKDGPFQPPKSDARGKPIKASHDIPGLNAQKSATGKPVDRRDNDRGFGRKTPDWDADTRGRRTPDADRRRDDRDRERSHRERERYGPDGERLSSRPPTGPSANERPPTRTRQSAFHHIQTNRSKNNVSPAASLLDVADSVPAMSNILLMPASSVSGSITPNPVTVSAPSELNPVVSLISSMSEQISTDKSVNDRKDIRDSKSSERDRDSKDRYRDNHKERDRYRDEKSRYGRDKERESRDDIHGNRSYDNLRDRSYKDSRNSSREKLSMYGSRDSLDERDDSRERGRRGDSRERSYRDDYYDRYRDRPRPPSRGSTVDTRRDYRDRDKDREYYRRNDRYDRDRPRSRQGDTRDRPSSRQGDSDRPRSRADYDREIERYREKYKGYGDYDDYYRRQYYDRQYYDYYYNSSQYNQGGYYDEHGYFHPDPNAQRYRYDQYHRRSRTGTPGSLSDGGEEIASIAENGKKSGTNSDKKRFDYPPDLHDYSRTSGYHDYYSYYGYEQNGHRWDPDISAWVATTTDVEPQRQTPEKFMIPHMRACFGPNGQLVKVIPNRPADGQPATVEIHDVHEMLEETEEARDLQEFPGPLVRGDTHKNDVLLFCQTKAKSCTENMNLEDRESAEIIWKFLELLIKQNGTIVGTDIADLILQGHEPTTQEFRRSGMKIAASSDNLDDADSEDGQKLSRGSTPIDRSLINKTKTTEEVTDRFRHLLMYGRKKDALEWAMKNNLWGHALFLASKMDSRAHANVMMRFANVAMRMNDPLQTLYQLMSGRQPAAVTCVAEERWGDWRPHLAMILSNSSQKADLDRKSITTLGDTLASKGFLHASHFCYLMSQTNFGTYHKKSSKIVLIGSSHGLPLEYFANNEAIQCTEIYEYALSLANAAISLINFQTYKYLYATRLADYGYAQEALQYCEMISKSINMNPACYQHTLVKLVYDLSSQLKFSQPEDNDNDEILDPDWLRALHTTLVQFEEGAIQPISGTATPAYFGGRTTASSDSGEVGMYMQGADSGNTYTQDSLYVPNTGGGMYSILENTQQSMVTDQSIQYQAQQQTNQYNQGYDGSQVNQYGTNQAVTHTGDQYTQQEGSSQHIQDNGNQYYHQQYQQDGSLYQQNGQNSGHNETQWTEQPTTESMQHQQQPGFESANQNQVYNSTTNQQADNNQQYTAGQFNAGFGGHEVPNHWSRQKQPSLPANVNLGESQSSVLSGQRSSLASTSEDGAPEEGEDRVDSGSYEPTPSVFDIQSNPGKIIPPKLRKRTISESSTGSGREHHPAVNKSQSQHDVKKSNSSNDSMSLSKQKQGAAGSGGIFAKIGGLFSRKNEMKLPDDKEPSIVWDPDKKRWIDKDADEQDEAPPAPPPKDHELPGSNLQRKSSMTEPSGMSSLSSNKDLPPTGGNKFSLKKGKDLIFGPKYVDVMNPKPATTSQVPSSLFHTLPSSHSAPAIFNPMGGSSDGQTSEPAQEPIPEEKSSTEGGNSHQTSSGNTQLPPSTGNSQAPPSNNTSLSRNSSGSSLSREVQRILSKALPGQTSALPTMFNPAQFQGNQTFKQPAPSGPGHRLSNRRVYPK